MQLPRRGLLSVIALAAIVWPGASSVAADDAPGGASASEGSRVVVTPASPDQIDEAARSAVTAMSVPERAAAVIMGHTPTTDPAAASAYLAETGIAGFILMGSNIGETEADVRALTRALSQTDALPPLVAVDQEGGEVRRLPWDQYASSLTLKDAGSDSVSAAFRGRGALVARSGIDLNFGVVADWTDDPGSFIFGRSLGTDPVSAADRVSAAVSAEAPFVATTLKHFPGHGAAPGDSHHIIPETGVPYDVWLRTEAAPFRAGIHAGAPFVMFGHLAYTAIDPLPASLSPEWHRILREDLGFDGVTVTDDMAMLEASGIAAYADPVANAVRALAAGNDLILAISATSTSDVTALVDGIVAGVADGSVPGERLEEAAARVMSARMTAAATVQGATPCADCTPVG